MSQWVKCTSAGGAGTEVFVNLGLALTISDYGTGTRIALTGNADTSQSYVDVSEKPAQILNSWQNAISQGDQNGNVGWYEANKKASMV
jgi:hypothetical protein